MRGSEPCSPKGPRTQRNRAPFKGVYRGMYRDIWGLYRGIKDPNNRVLGPKYYNINGTWALKPYIWVTLREGLGV